jgi:hypothetical protein
MGAVRVEWEHEAAGLDQEVETVRLCWGGEPSNELLEVDHILQAMLAETAAFRRHFQRADLQAVLPS